MKFYKNPKDRQTEDGLVRFTVEEDNIYRLRFGFTTPTIGPVMTRETAGAAFTPYDLLSPLVPRNVQSTTDAIHRDKSLIIPTGPAPSDATGVDQRLPDDPPTNVAAYKDLFSRYHVSAVEYFFKFFNYEDFDLVVGITVLPLSVVISEDGSGGLVKVNSEEFGNDVYFDPRQSDSRFVTLATKQNTIFGKLPAGRPTGLQAKIADQGGELAAQALHMNPGVATISQKVPLTKIYKALSTEGGFDGDYDVTKVSGDYADPPVRPDGAAGQTEAGVVVWLWVCNEQAYFEDMQGTAADSDDHFNGLHFEGWGSACNDWTAKVAVHPKVELICHLHDPIVNAIPTATAPDIIQAS